MGHFGDLIKKRREELNLKAYELANKIGVNPVYITQIERHGKLPSQIVAQAIDRVLNLDLVGFRLWVEEKYPNLKKTIASKPAIRGAKPARESIESNLFEFVYDTDNKNYRVFTVNLLDEYLPTLAKDEKTINAIINFCKKHRRLAMIEQNQFETGRENLLKSLGL